MATNAHQIQRRLGASRLQVRRRPAASVINKSRTQAPAAVVVCGSMAGLSVPESWVIACSAATENLLLAAHASGLGAVWLGVYPRPERVAGLKTLLGLPEEITPLDAVALGWPAEAKERADRFKPDRIHYEQW